MSWIRKNTLDWTQMMAVKILKNGPVPKHVAIIMDGNRRYATKNGLNKLVGHTQGFSKLTEMFQWCLEFGIPEVTVYAFSIENFKRSEEEVNNLMELTGQKFQDIFTERDSLMERGIRIRVIGNLSLMPKNLQALLVGAMMITKDNDRAFLNIAIAYTSRDEITHTVKDVVRGVERADILPADISEELISECLYTNNSPEPDLVIRTSGEVRFSDFLLWQTTCSCIYFTKVLWPEFSGWDLMAAVFYYQRCYTDIKSLKDTKETSFLNNDNSKNRVKRFVNRLQVERENTLEKICFGCTEA